MKRVFKTFLWQALLLTHNEPANFQSLTRRAVIGMEMMQSKCSRPRLSAPQSTFASFRDRLTMIYPSAGLYVISFQAVTGVLHWFGFLRPFCLRCLSCSTIRVGASTLWKAQRRWREWWKSAQPKLPRGGNDYKTIQHYSWNAFPRWMKSGAMRFKMRFKAIFWLSFLCLLPVPAASASLSDSVYIFSHANCIQKQFVSTSGWSHVIAVWKPMNSTSLLNGERSM